MYDFHVIGASGTSERLFGASMAVIPPPAIIGYLLDNQETGALLVCRVLDRKEFEKDEGFDQVMSNWQTNYLGKLKAYVSVFHNPCHFD